MAIHSKLKASLARLRATMPTFNFDELYEATFPLFLAFDEDASAIVGKDAEKKFAAKDAISYLSTFADSAPELLNAHEKTWRDFQEMLATAPQAPQYGYDRAITELSIRWLAC